MSIYSPPLDTLPHGYPPGKDMGLDITYPRQKGHGTRDIRYPASPLPVDRMTFACENITFSQLRLRAAIKRKHIGTRVRLQSLWLLSGDVSYLLMDSVHW